MHRTVCIQRSKEVRYWGEGGGKRQLIQIRIWLLYYRIYCSQFWEREGSWSLIYNIFLSFLYLFLPCINAADGAGPNYRPVDCWMLNQQRYVIVTGLDILCLFNGQRNLSPGNTGTAGGGGGGIHHTIFWSLPSNDIVFADLTINNLQLSLL